MKIAIASGKGGTGKTTISANLAARAIKNNASVHYADFDVEEPNGRIFLRPDIRESLPVNVMIPQVDQDTCIACGKCEEICQYGAIVVIGEQALVYPELCHSCGGCRLVCPVDAITEIPRQVGKIEKGDASSGIQFLEGDLNIGEQMATPVIRQLKKMIPEDGLVFMDAPPGTSCPVIETVNGADYTILVTEPTPFGLNDLELAVGMMRELSQPFGVVINRAGMGNDDVRDYLNREKIDILAEIPNDSRVAEAYSRGELAVNVFPETAQSYSTILKSIGAE